MSSAQRERIKELTKQKDDADQPDYGHTPGNLGNMRAGNPPESSD